MTRGKTLYYNSPLNIIHCCFFHVDTHFHLFLAVICWLQIGFLLIRKKRTHDLDVQEMQYIHSDCMIGVGGQAPKEKAVWAREELADIERAEHSTSRKLEMILSWFKPSEATSRKSRRSIIAMLIARIVAHSDYRLNLHFYMTASQYFRKVL